MKNFLILFCLSLVLFAAPAIAEEEKNSNVPFRTDSGLITAEYYLATGKYTQALRVLGGVLQRHPQNADAYAYSGYAWQHLEDMKKAEAHYQTALNIDPTHLGAQKYLGNIYLAKGDVARAMESLQALKITCGVSGCAELDELEADINRFKKPAK